MLKAMFTEVEDVIFEGDVEYDISDTSFNHEFGTEKRSDVVIKGVEGEVSIYDNNGNEVAVVAFSKVSDSLQEKIKKSLYDVLSDCY